MLKFTVSLLSLLLTNAVAHDVHVLIYETAKSDADEVTPAEHLMDQINDRINGVKVSVFGQGSGFEGYGSKFEAVLPVLERIEDKESLVVLTDSRDVLLNMPYSNDEYSHIIGDEFRMAFDELTFHHNTAIVVSAEAQCCVSALTHASPGSYYNPDGSRKQKACSSGEADCLWAGDEKALPWESFMEALMLDRTQEEGKEYDDKYLNAGLIAGKVKDLIRIINAAKIESSEDDQAVLTDYMFHHPKDIVLDYEQKMFGNNRGGVSNFQQSGCTFEKEKQTTISTSARLVHTKTNTSPMFVHSPGGFYECHDKLSSLLGVPPISTPIRRRLKQDRDRKLQCNYGKGGCATAEDESTTLTRNDEGESIFSALRRRFGRERN